MSSEGTHMTTEEFLKEVIARGESTDVGYFEYAHIAACILDKRLHEQLKQLVNGPIFDGDVVSKALRGELFKLGLATRVCFKGQQGYTGATYFAYSVLKRIEQIAAGQVAP